MSIALQNTIAAIDARVAELEKRDPGNYHASLLAELNALREIYRETMGTLKAMQTRMAALEGRVRAPGWNKWAERLVKPAPS